MNSGQPPLPQKDSGEPFSWKLRPTLQLNIKANSWNEFRPTPPPPERFRWTLQLKIKANSWNRGSAESSHELTWRRLFSFQLILVQMLFKTCFVRPLVLFATENCRKKQVAVQRRGWGGKIMVDPEFSFGGHTNSIVIWRTMSDNGAFQQKQMRKQKNWILWWGWGLPTDPPL